jgi:hypothetical protein
MTAFSFFRSFPNEINATMSLRYVNSWLKFQTFDYVYVLYNYTTPVMPRFTTEIVGGHYIYIYGAGSEHNPPHFHVVKKGNTVARYKISDFGLMPGDKGIGGKNLQALREFWEQNRVEMLDFFCKLNPKLCESRD